MKFYFILFYCFSVSVFAEENNQVYNKHSKLTVENINKAVEFFRNPTVMSGNFRQALKNMAPGISTASASSPSDSEDQNIPLIELVAKVLSSNKPSTVVLRVDNHIIHLTEGSTASHLVNKQIVNIRVDKVTETYVSIFLTPFEQMMVLQ